jgi:hypothetical protein
MPKCPHCGELVHIGQTTCYACGQKITARRTPGKKKPFNPMIPVIAGAAVLVVAVGLLLTLTGKPKEDTSKAREVELERLADSVRRSNREQRMQSAEFQEAERYRSENAQLQERFDRVVEQTVSDKPTPEQQRLIVQIRTGLGLLGGMADRIAMTPGDERRAEADSLRAEQRRVRALISDLGRAPKSGN